MIKFPTRWEQWFKALLAAAIGGGANAITGLLGPSITNAIGATINTPNLSKDQIKSTFIGGAIIGMAFYLKQSPVPPDKNGGNTDFFTKKPDSTNPPVQPPPINK